MNAAKLPATSVVPATVPAVLVKPLAAEDRSLDPAESQARAPPRRLGSALRAEPSLNRGEGASARRKFPIPFAGKEDRGWQAATLTNCAPGSVWMSISAERCRKIRGCIAR